MKGKSEYINIVYRRVFFAVMSAAIVLAFSQAPLAEARKGGSSTKSGKSCDTRQAKEAQAHGYHSRDGRKHRVPGKSASHINKILKMGDLYIAASGKAAAIKAEIDVTINKFTSLYKKGGLTEEAIEDYAKKMGELRTLLLQNNLKATYNAKQILTQAQREMLYKSYASGKKDCGKKDG